MNTHQIANIAVKAGELLLKSGAEIYRVEDTITRICRSYGLECETFVLPTGIFISASNALKHEIVSYTKRIRARTVNLQIIEMVNTFSRNLENKVLSYEEAASELGRIQSLLVYKNWQRLLASSIASFCFTLLIRGSVYDGIAAFASGMLIFFLREFMGRAGMFMFFDYFLSGTAAGMFAFLVRGFVPSLDLYKIVIGSIMMLLPGVAITNSIKDALYGDLVASVARFGEALLMVSALGAGVGFGITLLLELT